MALSAFALILVLRQGVPTDSVEAIRQAQALVLREYANLLLDSRGDQILNAYEITGSCRGVFFADCMYGDWSCRGSDCGNPATPAKRAALIAELERLAPFARGSDWVVRQRVAFALKHGELQRAREIAYECLGIDWWCMALRGLAEHRLQPGAGLAHFDSALARAPPAVRCRWTDLSFLAARTGFDTPITPSCGEDSSFAARYWWLADPLWLRPGNERYSEHLSRHIMLRMHEDIMELLVDSLAHGAYLLSRDQLYDSLRRGSSPPELIYLRERLGYDLRQRDVIIAQGFANSWRAVSRSTPPGGIPGRRESSIRSQLSARKYVYGGYSFVPDQKRFQNPSASVAADWAVEWDRGMERYVTAERWFNLDQQTAVFRRGEKLLVVIAAKLPSVFDSSDGIAPYFALGRVDDMRVFSQPFRIEHARELRGGLTVDAGAYLASLEAVARGLIGRARYGVPVPPLVDGFGLSDIALLDAGHGTDDVALDAMLLPSLTVQAGARLGVYFEMYGVPDDETVSITVTLASSRRSLLHRVFRVIGFGEDKPLRLSWREISPSKIDETAKARLFTLNLDNSIQGENRLLIELHRADGRRATASRILRVSHDPKGLN